MAIEKQVQHYLPAAAYLSFFDAPLKPGFIWVYHRGAEPVLVNISRVAKERNIWDPQIEQLLTVIEDEARPILERLNSNPPSTNLTAVEEYGIAAFASLLASRVPGQRRVAQEVAGAMAKVHLQAKALNPGFQAEIDAAKAKGELPETVNLETVQKTILSEKFKLVMNENPAMLLALNTAPALIPTFLMKRLCVVRSATEEFFITSDYPVLRMGAPDLLPLYGDGGFLMSNVFLPIGRSAMLAWLADDNKQPPKGPDELVRVVTHQVTAAQVRLIGKTVLHVAERFVFGPERNEKLKQLFDGTQRPERFEFQSPFSTGAS